MIDALDSSGNHNSGWSGVAWGQRVRDNCGMKLLPTTISRAFFLAAAVWTGMAGAMLAAENAEDAFNQAKHAMDHGEYDAAIQKLDEAIRLEPKQAKHRGLRGVVWLRKGDYAQGTADLKAAIAMNPGDVGAKAPTPPAIKLSDEVLRHGKQQVARMLKDRPAMAQYGEETAFLRDWAERKFAGESFGALIDWDPSPPLHSDAEHLAPDGDDHAAVLVEANYTAGPNEGKPRSFEELWAGAVYELHNVVYAREFVRLNDEAAEGKLSKNAFVAGILRYELLAAQQTRAFYLRVFLPWAEKKKLPTDPKLWFCDWWDTPRTVLQSFTDKSEYPWRPYARTHDWATVHRFWRQEKYLKAKKILEQMIEEEGYDEEDSDVSYWIGRCYVHLNKPAEAIEAFTEAIRLEPHSAESYRARGEVYEKLGEKTKAEADLKMAKELEGGE
jgi:Flp pilus assembly protein TadD